MDHLPNILERLNMNIRRYSEWVQFRNTTPPDQITQQQNDEILFAAQAILVNVQELEHLLGREDPFFQSIIRELQILSRQEQVEDDDDDNDDEQMQLSTVNISRDQLDCYNEECSSCKEPLNDGQVILRFNCRHCMHEECANSWFNYRNTCPTCRTQVSEVRRTI